MKYIPVIKRNFEGMTTFPEPKAFFTQVKECLVEGQSNTWNEYVPTTYTGESEVPLILDLHGGGGDGLDSLYSVPWHVLAEERNLIVVFPSSPDFGGWNCGDGDVEFLYRLIARMCERYKIDRTRIYMQGMSNGDRMTLEFTAHHPEILAAAANLSGCVQPLIYPVKFNGPLPDVQMRGEKDVPPPFDELPEDVYEPRAKMNDHARKHRMELNNTAKVPRIYLRGVDNFALYEGNPYDFLYWEIADMGHRVKPHTPFVLYDYFYSGFRRIDGTIVRVKPVRDLACELKDDRSFAVCCGSRLVYMKGEVRAISDDIKAKTRVIGGTNGGHPVFTKMGEMMSQDIPMVPVEILSVVSGAEVHVDHNGEWAFAEYADGRKYKFVSRSQLYHFNDE